MYSEVVVSTGGFHPYTGAPVDPNGPDCIYKWRLSSAILFTVTILTTIGYGHVFPRSDVGRLACILYSIIAIPLTSVFLLRIGAGVGKSVQFLYNKGICCYCGKRRIKKAAEDIAGNNGKPFRYPVHHDDFEVNARGYLKKTPKLPIVLKVIDKKPYKNVEELTDRYVDYYSSNVPTTLLIFITVIYLLTGTIMFHFTEGDWSYVNALYCCIITLLTIGFGDLVPGLSGIAGNNSGIVPQFWLTFCSLYIMIGLAILGMAISIIGAEVEELTEHHEEENSEEEKQLKAVEEEMRLQEEMAANAPEEDEEGAADVDPYAHDEDGEHDAPPAVAS